MNNHNGPRNKMIFYLFIFFSLSIIAGCNLDSASLDGGSLGSGQVISDSIESNKNLNEIEINLFRFGFEPEITTVKKGDLVRFVIKNLDVPHGLAIDDYNINIYLNGGETKTLEFLADKSGIFEMYCSLPCGSGHGLMKGAFIVEE
jgi:heme/copper-type cytochrome/quinol oxidase subunit 2